MANSSNKMNGSERGRLKVEAMEGFIGRDYLSIDVSLEEITWVLMFFEQPNEPFVVGEVHLYVVYEWQIGCFVWHNICSMFNGPARGLMVVLLAVCQSFVNYFYFPFTSPIHLWQGQELFIVCFHNEMQDQGSRSMLELFICVWAYTHSYSCIQFTESSLQIWSLKPFGLW